MGLDVLNNDSSAARCDDDCIMTTTTTAAATTTTTTTTTTTRPVLTRVIPNAPIHRNLQLAMLGCETKFPYGPNEHTAQILMDLVVLGATEHFSTRCSASSSSSSSSSAAHSDTNLHSNSSSNSSSSSSINNNNTATNSSDEGFQIHLHLFNAQAGDYPDDWDAFDGFLLPGSFSSAYDLDPWIIQLKQIIQTHLVPQQRRILAICFGHQVLAHSFFPQGKAARMELGARVGRHGMPTTTAGKQMLLRHYHCMISDDEIDLYCTHGDNVEQLPDSAICLGGNERVPIQAAAYFASPQDADQWRQNNEASRSNDSNSTLSLPRPFAISFQAHPEYATSRKLGLERTLQACINAMNERGAIDTKTKDQAGKDATDNFDQVQKDSVHVMVHVGRWLDWFPAFGEDD